MDIIVGIGLIVLLYAFSIISMEISKITNSTFLSLVLLIFVIRFGKSFQVSNNI